MIVVQTTRRWASFPYRLSAQFFATAGPVGQLAGEKVADVPCHAIATV